MSRRGCPAAFVTYGWCRTAYGIVRSLGRRGVEVHVGDMSRLAMARHSRYCRSFSRLPDFYTEPDRYVDCVVAAMRRRGATVLLPGHEDIGVFAERRDRLPGWIRLALPDAGAFRLAEDKHLCLDRAAEGGIAIPQCRPVARLEDLAPLTEELLLPLVVKTRIGNSAKGVAVARSADQVKQHFEGFIERYDLAPDRWPILQEFLPGRAVGVCGLAERGEVRALFGEQYLRCKDGGLQGTSTLRKGFRDEGLFDQARKLMRLLNWHGVFHCDFLESRNGRFCLIEVNPRPWGALWLAVAAGVDIPWLWYRQACGMALPDRKPDFREATRCRWILGEAIAGLKLAAGRNVGDLLGLLATPSAGHYDDFDPHDPAPMVFEALDYLTKALRAFGTNPVRKGMIR